MNKLNKNFITMSTHPFDIPIFVISQAEDAVEII